jgi:hypothetical protein
MSVLSELMDFFTGVSPVANANSVSNNTNGFASNESGTRRQYAWASPREASAATPGQQPGSQESASQSGLPIGGLTKAQTTNIIFNEVRSLSGPDTALLYKYMAHTIWNGAQFEKDRPSTAGTSVKIAPGEVNTYNAIKSAVDEAYDDRRAGRNPLPPNVTHFVLKRNFTTAPQRLSTRPSDPPVEWAGIVGPFNNSWTGGGLSRTDVHVNFYYNKATSVQIQRGAPGYSEE